MCLTTDGKVWQGCSYLIVVSPKMARTKRKNLAAITAANKKIKTNCGDGPPHDGNSSQVGTLFPVEVKKQHVRILIPALPIRDTKMVLMKRKKTLEDDSASRGKERLNSRRRNGKGSKVIFELGTWGSENDVSIQGDRQDVHLPKKKKIQESLSCRNSGSAILIRGKINASAIKFANSVRKRHSECNYNGTDQLNKLHIRAEDRLENTANGNVSDVRKQACKHIKFPMPFLPVNCGMEIPANLSKGELGELYSIFNVDGKERTNLMPVKASTRSTGRHFSGQMKCSNMSLPGSSSLLQSKDCPEKKIGVELVNKVDMVRKKLHRVGGLRRWLFLQGLEQFAKIFQEHNIDEIGLLQLTMDALKDIGVLAVGPRRKLIWSINHLCNTGWCPVPTVQVEGSFGWRARG